MQLTQIDRWLRKRFVYETHIYTLREPEVVPAGVIVEEMPDEPGRRFRHRMVIRSERIADRVIAGLKDANQMFTTRVVDRREWYVPFLAPKDRSVVWWLFWAGVGVCLLLAFISFGMVLWGNPELRKNAAEALQILKG